MGATAAALVAVVRSGLGIADAPTTPIDTDLVTLAIDHDVVPNVLAATTQGAPVTDAAERTLAVLRRSLLVSGAQAEATCVRTTTLLGDAGIPSLCLKGVALGALTGRPAADRVGVDVDLLVQPARLGQAIDVLCRSGYAVVPNLPDPRVSDLLSRVVRFTSYELTLAGHGGYLDLHWRITPGHPRRLATAELLARSVDVVLAGAAVRTLDPDAALAHVCLHAAKDGWSSLRTLVDAHLLVERAGAGWQRAAGLADASAAVGRTHRLTERVLAGGDPCALDEVSAPSSNRWVRALQDARMTPSVASYLATTGRNLVSVKAAARSTVPRRWWWVGSAGRLARSAQRGAMAGGKTLVRYVDRR